MKMLCTNMAGDRRSRTGSSPDLEIGMHHFLAHRLPRTLLDKRPCRQSFSRHRPSSIAERKIHVPCRGNRAHGNLGKALVVDLDFASCLPKQDPECGCALSKCRIKYSRSRIRQRTERLCRQYHTCRLCTKSSGDPFRSKYDRRIRREKIS